MQRHRWASPAGGAQDEAAPDEAEPRWPALLSAALDAASLVMRLPTAARASLRPHAPRPYYNPAYAYGYDDGYRLGLQDGRGWHRHHLRRVDCYRNGGRGYGRMGDSDRRFYRDGFATGYDAGYREGRAFD